MKKSRAELEAEIQRLKTEVRKLRAEINGRPKPRGKVRKPRKITKSELSKFVKQSKTTKSISKYYKVSESTVKLKIAQFGLVGLRKRGKKPLVKRPKLSRPKLEWIPTRKYIDKINKAYRFVNIAYPPFKWANPKTYVCSDRKDYPKEKFTTVGVYYIVQQSDVYFVNYTRIRYSDKPVEFDEIYAWAKENMLDILGEQYRKASFAVERIIAYTFLLPEKKPKVIKTG